MGDDRLENPSRGFWKDRGVNTKRELAVGIDLGGTNLKVALVSQRGEIVRTTERRTQTDREPEAVIDDMAVMVNRLIEEQAASRDDIVGLGVG